MKRLTVTPAIVLFVVSAGFATSASAQVRTTPAGKLFFEGDIVKHNLDNAGAWSLLRAAEPVYAARPSRGARAYSSPTALLPTTKS